MPGPAPLRWPAPMQNEIRDYDWGSTSTLARLQGRRPSGAPEAELWVGAHPAAPSWLVDGDVRHRLDQVILDHAEEVLGPDCLTRFGPQLPFLTKLLAIERALSVQVHPTADQAEKGYDAERSADPPAGGYRFTDPYPKPEMVYALSPMQVLSGCRPAEEAAGLLDRMLAAPCGAGGPDRRRELARLRETLSAGTVAALADLARWSPAERSALAGQTVETCRCLAADGAGDPLRGPDPFGWMLTLAEQHPGDPLALAPALLRLLELPVGGTMFLPAGVPHAYLRGFGLEVMAPSDNVVRAGLTSKRVDADALVELLDPAADPVLDLPSQRLGAAQQGWSAPTPWFRLARVELTAGTSTVLAPVPTGPQVLLCTRGSAVVRADSEASVSAGGSLFLGHDCGPVTVRGDAELFRTSVGE